MTLVDHIGETVQNSTKLIGAAQHWLTLNGLFHSTRVSGAGRCFNGETSAPVTSFASRAHGREGDIHKLIFQPHVMGWTERVKHFLFCEAEKVFFQYQFQERFGKHANF